MISSSGLILSRQSFGIRGRLINIAKHYAEYCGQHSKVMTAIDLQVAECERLNARRYRMVHPIRSSKVACNSTAKVSSQGANMSTLG